MKREPMNLKERKEEYMGIWVSLEGGKGEMIQLYCNLKKRRKYQTAKKY